MRSSFLTILFLLTCELLFAQNRYEAPITVYPTYADYVNDTGTKYACNFREGASGNFFGGYFYAFSAKKTGCEEEVKKVNIKTSKVWGFKYGETLYRISPNGLAMQVTKYGDLYYYEICDYRNSMETFLPPDADKDMIDGEITESAISDSLNSRFIYNVKSAVSRRHRSIPLEEIWEILQDKPNGKAVFDCITGKKSFSEIRECFGMLEGK